MAITWTVEVLATGRENAQIIEFGVADSDQKARAAAAAALGAGARERGRHEFWVNVGGLAMMVVPGLDDVGNVDATGLQDALNLLPGCRDDVTAPVGSDPHPGEASRQRLP